MVQNKSEQQSKKRAQAYFIARIIGLLSHRIIGKTNLLSVYLAYKQI